MMAEISSDDRIAKLSASDSRDAPKSLEALCNAPLPFKPIQAVRYSLRREKTPTELQFIRFG